MCSDVTRLFLYNYATYLERGKLHAHLIKRLPWLQGGLDKTDIHTNTNTVLLISR